MCKTIVLIGFMGCGKTRLGQYAARVLGMEFADTDSLIEQEAGMSISQIFAKQGEEAFRKWETEVLGRSCRQRGRILATGGGIVKNPQNVEMLHAMDVSVVWLVADAEQIYRRLRRDNTRPLLAGTSGEVKRRRIELLLREREELYKKAAQYVFVEEGFSEEQMGEAFVQWLEREIFEKDGKKS